MGVEVVVEGLFEGAGLRVAERPSLLLQSHYEGFRRVLVEEGEHVEEDVGESEARVATGVVDAQLIVVQPSTNVKVANASVELGREVEALALEALVVGHVVGHGVVSAGDAEGGEVDAVRQVGHPARVGGVVGVEAEAAVVAMVACLADHTGRDGQEQVEDGADADDGEDEQRGQAARPERAGAGDGAGDGGQLLSDAHGVCDRLRGKGQKLYRS